MDVPRACQEIRADVEGGLAAATDDAARAEVLVQGLYRLLDSVLGGMGPPGRSAQYLRGQAAALDLIVFLCLPLVRGPQGTRDLVSVLAEVKEGTADPVLQQKLAGYARQLLAQRRSEKDSAPAAAGAPWFVGGGALAVALVLAALLWPHGSPERSAVLSRDGGGDSAPAAAASAPAPAEHAALPSREAASGARDGSRPGAPRPEKQELVTRIRVVANQVLVPVTVRNGSETVKVTLLLDTGSTRTALGETFATRLGIDLAKARGSLVEVADGRVLHTKLATVDQVAVGSRSVPGFEMEFFPYNGSDQGFDGFLGMDFLGRQRYQLDVENGVIRWF